jgi:hypothetical protein
LLLHTHLYPSPPKSFSPCCSFPEAAAVSLTPVVPECVELELVCAAAGDGRAARKRRGSGRIDKRCCCCYAISRSHLNSTTRLRVAMSKVNLGWGLVARQPSRLLFSPGIHKTAYMKYSFTREQLLVI